MYVKSSPERQDAVVETWTTDLAVYGQKLPLSYPTIYDALTFTVGINSNWVKWPHTNKLGTSTSHFQRYKEKVNLNFTIMLTTVSSFSQHYISLFLLNHFFAFLQFFFFFFSLMPANSKSSSVFSHRLWVSLLLS